MTRMTTKNYLHRILYFFSRQAKNFLVLCLVMLCLHLYHKDIVSKRSWGNCTKSASGMFYELIMEMNTTTILRLEVERLKKRLELLTATRVKVTMYHPVSKQTDSTPNITADGTIIKIDQASSYRYVAVSRDLLKSNGGHLSYGDYVVLQGTGKKDGLYQVRDTMAPRWTNRIDILESPSVAPYKFEEAMLVYVNDIVTEN